LNHFSADFTILANWYNRCAIVEKKKISGGIVKQRIIIVALIMAVMSLSAWEINRQCEFPGNNYGIDVIGSHIWATGTGAIVAHSADSGASFDFVETPAYSGDYPGLAAVAFGDAQHGIIVGEDGVAMLTADGGTTWTINADVAPLMGGNLINDAAYMADGHIIVASASGTIAISSDFGTTWAAATLGSVPAIKALSLDASGTGYAVTAAPAALLKTTDFGANWTTVQASISADDDLLDVLHDGDLVMVSGEAGIIQISIDAGITMVDKSLASCTTYLHSITKVNDSYVVAGWYGWVITANADWTTVTAVENNYNDHFQAITTDDAGIIYGTGYRGEIVKSTDNGASWNELVVPATYLLSGSAVNASTWYLGGDYGYLLKTTDGGQSYEKIFVTKTTDKFYACHFIDENTGMVAGNTDGTIYRTVDGGASWTAIENSEAGTIYKFSFIDANTGIAVGSSNKWLTTTDGGASWQLMANQADKTGYAVYMKDANTIIAGSSGSTANMVVSSDAGATWNLFSLGTKKVKEIAFKDDNIGVIVTEGGHAYYTSTGGLTADAWAEATLPTEQKINGVTVDAEGNFVLSGYANSDGNFGLTNAIMVSSDNGATWTDITADEPEYNPVRLNGIISAGTKTIAFGAFQLVYTHDAPLPDAPAVFFSEYIEGSSNNKALEIFNNSGATINLADFRINQSVNGGGWQYQHSFPADATLDNQDVWTIITDQTDVALFDPANADEVLSYPSVVHHNGDDARALEWTPDGGATWIILDLIGDPDNDPGDGWDVAGEVAATKNHTLVRKSDITVGTTDWAASAGTSADDSQWTVYPEDTFSYLGSHNIPTDGTISGTITLDGGAGTITDVVITAGTQTTNPAADGTYQISIAAGTYSVTATLDGYETATANDVTVVAGQATEGIDLTLTEIVVTLAPAENLTADVTDFNDVVLNWDEPGTASATWLAYDNGENADGIGTNGPADFSVASRWESSAITAYDGMQIKRIKFFPREENCEYSIRVWTGENAATLVLDQVVTNFTNEAWNTVVLDTPVTIDASQELWFGYRCNTQAGFPAGVDAGPANAGYGDLLSEDGVTWTSISNAYDLDYNWNLQAMLMNADGEMVEFAPVAQKAAPATPAISTSSFAAGNLGAPASSRALTGYKVMRDGAEIATIDDFSTTTYTDSGLDAGTYEYTIIAVYDEGNAPASNAVIATVALPAPANFNAVSQGPAQSTIMCTWNAPAASRAITGYKVYRNDEEIGTSDGLFYADTNVASGEYTYYVKAVYSDTYESAASNSVTVQHTDGSSPLVPAATALVGNYPNPFNPTTSISFSLNQSQHVNITVYNVRGEAVKTLVNKELAAANHTVEWDGTDASNNSVASGMYFYRMQTAKMTQSKKMMLLK
jgi:photosystem II stability/assembly factor-like uncharacterized protein